jgi:hypothetical protein
MGVYGWWTDLNPGAAGSQVSTFRATDGAFVVEYINIPVVNAPAAYRVSFQIALYADGRVALNYRDLPVFMGAPLPVTIGMHASDGRYYNQVACVTAATEIGVLPQPYQSLIFQPEDLY